MEGHLANILVVIGFFILLFGSISYGGQILGKLTGTQDSVFIGAAGCTGLTGATLAACQKAQPKPKPAPKPAAVKPKPPQGITAAKPKPKPRPASVGPAVPYAQKVCTDKNGTWRAGKCFMPITPIDRKTEVVVCALKRFKEIQQAASKYQGWQAQYAVQQVAKRIATECAKKYGLPHPDIITWTLKQLELPKAGSQCPQVCKFDPRNAACRYYQGCGIPT